MSKKKVVVIGGGAAGFFAALSAKKHHPNAHVLILEKSAKLLAKVKISGGGRCNVTHACFDNKKLASHYPRGENYLRKAFEQFNAQSTINWFKERGVLMKTYPDGCLFPESNDSQTIIDCFEQEAKKLGIQISLHQGVKKIETNTQGFTVHTDEKTFAADRIIITTGGQPKRQNFDWLEKLGHEIIDPVPSLFTFNMPNNPIRELMGTVVEKVSVKVEGTKLLGQGPLLITHWGMSGPAVLLLSAWGARILAEKSYQFHVLVNWLNETKETDLRSALDETVQLHGAKKVQNLNPFPITNRLWHFLLAKAEIPSEIRWHELGKKNTNKLINILLNDRYEVAGKTTFKEEFVTAGGISMTDIDIRNMESKRTPGIHFAGEILDIDGITGGFNFQAAWTTGYIAGKNCLN
ncbi:MAG: NAD(P)/FAD-dependent oxidoreductase [Flavobacteriales bacterium]